jgi:hypothetical protein
MRTVMIDALMVDVQAAVESLEGARAVRGFDGKVWVQSPDFDRMQASELEFFVASIAGKGVSVRVLENQDAFPEGIEDAE